MKPFSVDFSKEEEGEGGVSYLIPGNYPFKITGIVKKLSKKTEAPYYQFSLTHKQVTLPYRATLTPKSLWKLRKILEACGLEVPKGPVMIKPDELRGKTVMTTVEDRPFTDKKGQQRKGSEITDVWNPELSKSPSPSPEESEEEGEGVEEEPEIDL